MNIDGCHDKWVAGGGTTALGIIGSAAGGLSLANQMFGGKGLFGGGRDSDARFALAKEQSERFTLEQVILAYEKNYAQFDALKTKAAETEAKLNCLEQKLTTYEVTQREIAELRGKLVDQKIDCLADKVVTGFSAANNKFSAIDAQIAGFTKVVIPVTAICDTSNNGCYNSATQQ